MATRLNPALRGLLEKFLVEFEAAIVAQVAPAGAKRGARAAPPGAAPPRPGARMCPVPGCPNASAGPRNRFFCSAHAKSLSRAQQDKVLAAGTREAQAPAARVVTDGRRKRRGPRGPLDMRCRVEGCKSLSKGPRFGFMCTDHLKSLSKKQQEDAREKYKAKKAAAAA